MTKRLSTIMLAALTLPTTLVAQSQGWPADYSGVMMQGFYWDSFAQSKWAKLEKMTPDLKGYFDLVWVPQSGKCLSDRSMGYDPYYYFNQNSSFGTEQELRSMIQTFKTNGIGTIADVVVNHRNTTGWFTFPAETYNGVTYQMTSSDITANDDGGKTAEQAAQDGVTLSSNRDEGEDFGGFRDLDHKSENVRNIVKVYTKYLLDDLGYTGFRYDVAKGFAPGRFAEYNNHAAPKFSVAEVWDGDSKIKSVINGADKTTAAFDFQFKYTVNNAANNGNWANLTNQNDGNWPLVSESNEQGAYRQYAVTFVENHDTELRPDGTSNGPLRRDTLAANAYLLAMPGTPCVFYKHYLAYPAEIKGMIDVRKAAGITNTSTYFNQGKSADYCSFNVTGSKGKLLVNVGKGWAEPASNRWVKVLGGHHYAYYLSPSSELAFADKPSGTYDKAFEVTLTAVSQQAGAKLVYTLNGETPTATSGTVVNSRTKISITDNCTLSVGLLTGGTVTSVITRQYSFATPEEVTFEVPPTGYRYTAYFVAPKTWDSDTEVHAWAWIDNGANYTPDNAAQWPGDKEHVYRIQQTADGAYVWQWCYYGSETVPPAKIIFNNGSGGVGSNQTKDMTFTNGGWYNMNTSVSNPTLGIKGTPRAGMADDSWYTLSGTRTSRPTHKGIYIHNGRKVVVR